ncbi:DNA replication complex GINS protein psf3 [Phytophthora cinnamomi]|uniref:DNA replication complex GINS protein psf3 n=1 Tax=Phytophthora cinnamomi TaxID=4785 RepID=UPI00355962C6|nr:DNA replication complex GINS protein psf3 [Phytophthora cinnamomi]
MSTSMGGGGYLDIDEILAGDERVKCTFETDALDCGYLDPSCRAPDLAEKAVVELPLWLATTLARRGDVRVEPPRFLTKRFRRMLKAGPSSVNLREFSSYVLEVGRQLAPLVEPAAQQEIDEVLRLCFGGERYRELLNNAMSSLDEDTTEFTRKLTQDEKKLFDAGVRDAKDFLQWKGRNADAIAAAPVVERSLKKRKFRA